MGKYILNRRIRVSSFNLDVSMNKYAAIAGYRLLEYCFLFLSLCVIRSSAEPSWREDLDKLFFLPLITEAIIPDVYFRIDTTFSARDVILSYPIYFFSKEILSNKSGFRIHGSGYFEPAFSVSPFNADFFLGSRFHLGKHFVSIPLDFSIVLSENPGYCFGSGISLSFADDDFIWAVQPIVRIRRYFDENRGSSLTAALDFQVAYPLQRFFRCIKEKHSTGVLDLIDPISKRNEGSCAYKGNNSEEYRQHRKISH